MPLYSLVLLYGYYIWADNLIVRTFTRFDDVFVVDQFLSLFFNSSLFVTQDSTSFLLHRDCVFYEICFHYIDFRFWFRIQKYLKVSLTHYFTSGLGSSISRIFGFVLVFRGFFL